jgi:hypothetical protein
MRGRYQAQEQTFAQAMAARAEWEHATEHTRYLAIAADGELRRRYPDQRIEPLRSAEPARSATPTAPTCISPRTRRSARWRSGVNDLAAQRHAFRRKMDERQAL